MFLAFAVLHAPLFATDLTASPLGETPQASLLAGIFVFRVKEGLAQEQRPPGSASFLFFARLADQAHDPVPRAGAAGLDGEAGRAALPNPDGASSPRRSDASPSPPPTAHEPGGPWSEEP